MKAWSKKWSYPFCPRHPKLRLRMQQDVLFGTGVTMSHIEACPQGCLWGYKVKENEWVLLKLIEFKGKRE